jgi:hypothetical protein
MPGRSPRVDYHALEIGQTITLEELMTPSQAQCLRSTIYNWGRRNGRTFSVKRQGNKTFITRMSQAAAAARRAGREEELCTLQIGLLWPHSLREAVDAAAVAAGISRNEMVIRTLRKTFPRPDPQQDDDSVGLLD